MTQSIYELDAADQELLDRYCEVDGAIGEAFADEDCTLLVENWREIAQRRIEFLGPRGWA